MNKLYNAIRDVTFELKEAIALSKIVIWKWTFASNIYSSLPLRVSRAIETKYEVRMNLRYFFGNFFD